MKFAYFGYRAWAERILNNLQEVGFNIDSFSISRTEYCGEKSSETIDPKTLDRVDFRKYGGSLFYGWSWRIPRVIVEGEVPCVCLHPSPLPRYRGGSPIQNQIIAGENESAVTLFKMSKGLDDGPIYYQEKFSLEGRLFDILDRISNIGSDLSRKLLTDFISGNAHTSPQDESLATTCKRRSLEDSELTIGKISMMTSRQIYDFIRALQPPYPQAFFRGVDGKKMLLGDNCSIGD